MALISFLVAAWALGWLLYRAYCVLTTPNDILIEKLGLDIPPVPLITLENISSKEVQISWSHYEVQQSVHSYIVELNNKSLGQPKKSETTATIHNLLPGAYYDIRVFTVSGARFQTPSRVFRVRTSVSTEETSSEDSNDGQPFLRAYAAKAPALQSAPASALMTRELSGGQTVRRLTAGRRSSPAHATGDIAVSAVEETAQGGEDDFDDLAQLSEKYQKIQQETEAVETQIVDAERDYEAQSRQLEGQRDDLKRKLKDRDEQSSDLKKQVHKLESANRTAQSEKNKKERLLQEKDGQRKKRQDQITRWDEQIASMKDEMAGIHTQKVAIEKRAQSDVAEYRRKIEEEQREIAILEQDNKEKAEQIKALEEERKDENDEEETDETREADRAELQKEEKWKDKLAGLGQTYTHLWQHLQYAREQHRVAQERLHFLESTRRLPHAPYSPIAPLDMDAVQRGQRHSRRPRHGSSLASSVSSPRGGFPLEHYPATHYITAPTASPTTAAPLFNMANGTTLGVTEESVTPPLEELQEVSESVPMSPRADALLPADLLGDESADELAEDDIMQSRGKTVESFSPFPTMPPPLIAAKKDQAADSPPPTASPSLSSPDESTKENDEPSEDSDQPSKEQPESSMQQSSRKLANIFSFNRQRGKTTADQPPQLGALKPGQSQSFPRNLGDELDPIKQRRRMTSYGGNWAFGTNLLTRPAGNGKDSHPPSTRRAFPSMFGLGKSTNTPAFDPFTARTNSLDADIRVDNSSPRPSSTYSFHNFDDMPRPSMESQFRAWGPERGGIRGSPLAPDWVSTHSFSRNPSRRASIQQGSTSNLSLVARGEQDFLDANQRPVQAPIGTRPPSSQRPATPKLNPAAPSFMTLFNKSIDKNRGKDKTREPPKEKPAEVPEDTDTPPDSRQSKDTPSIAITASTRDSRESLERLNSAQSGAASQEVTPVKPTILSKITRKASSNRFGSWKDKGGGLFSRKDASTPTNGEGPEELSVGGGGDSSSVAEQQLGKSLESTSTTPSAEEKKTGSRTSLSWNFIRSKSKKSGAGGGFGAGREDLTASEVSESSERASEVGDEDGEP